MTLLSATEQNRSLALFYGASRGAGSSATHELALFTGDPRTGGTELTATGGYARVSITNDGTNWPAPSGGMILGADQTFAASSGAWSDTATWWVLYAVDSGEMADGMPLDDEIDVSVTGETPRVRPRIFYNGGL